MGPVVSVEGISQPWHTLAPSLGAKGQVSWVSWQQVYSTVDSSSMELSTRIKSDISCVTYKFSGNVILLESESASLTIYATEQRTSIHVRDAKKYMECECDWMREVRSGSGEHSPVIIKVYI